MADRDLYTLFGRALDDEPGPLPDAFAAQAMAGGIRLRRRRWLATLGTASVLTVLAAAAVSAVLIAGSNPAGPAGGRAAPTAPIVAMLLMDAGCSTPASTSATDVAVFLRTDITDEQRNALEAALRSDPLVRSVRFESRQDAYARFRRMYSNAPHLLDATKPENLLESFRLRLTEPSGYPKLARRFADAAGVEQIVGGTCPLDDGSLADDPRDASGEVGR